MHDPRQRDPLVGVFKALADDNRLRIVGLLAARAMPVEELADYLGLESPTVSHHLRALFKAGLVRAYAVAHRRYYELDRPRLQTLADDLSSDERLLQFAAGTEAGAYARKVLATYLDDGRIAVLPVQPKKLRVLLRWVASNLDADLAYDEATLHDALSAMHDDVPRLQQELEAAGLLDRTDDGRYRRRFAPPPTAAADGAA